MKKTILALTAISCLAAVMLTACTPEGEIIEQNNNFSAITEAYEKVYDAEKITREVEITDGSLIVYESVKTYELDGEEYAVTFTTKRLNDLTAEEAYTVTEETTTAAKATEFTDSLDFKKEYFEDGYKLSETSFTATVKSEHVKDFLGIAEELPAATDEFKVTASLSSGKLTSFQATYLSGNYNISITLSFEY